MAQLNIQFEYEPNDRNQDIKLAVGECIVAWSQIEIFLSMIFNEVLSSTFHHITGLEIWKSVNGLRIKMDMMNSVITPQFTTNEISQKWGLLSDKIDKQISKRNEVSHSGIAEVHGEITLIPYLALGLPDKNKVLTLEKIKERTANFLKLNKEVSDFYSLIANWKRQHREELLQAAYLYQKSRNKHSPQDDQTLEESQ